MKNIRKILAVVLTMTMLFAMGITAAADTVTTGTITIENATKGMTYQAYKLFDATYNDEGGVAYKVPADKKISLDTTLFEISSVADADGNHTFGKKSGVSDADVIAWMKTNYATFAGNAITGAWADDGSRYVFTNLDFGYYYITSSLGSVVTIDSAVPEVTVRDKNNSVPEFKGKYITAEDDTAFPVQNVTENDAGVGSVEDFEITFNAVNWITTTDAATGEIDTVKAKSYDVTDTPVGLDVDKDSIEIYVIDNGTEKEITSTATISEDSTTGVVTIHIPWADANGNSLYQPEAATGTETQTPHIPVRIVYQAAVTKASATALGKNTAEVFYNVNVSMGTKVTETTTYRFKLNKSKEDYSALLGSKFELYKGSVAEANKVKFSVTDNTYTADPAGTVTEIDLTTVASATILGLDKADYVLHETVVPAGYNQAEDMTVAGNLLAQYNVIPQDAENVIEGDDRSVITVVNQQGSVLPSTGGMGTQIFYIAGSVLALGAIVILITKKRMSIQK